MNERGNESAREGMDFCFKEVSRDASSIRLWDEQDSRGGRTHVRDLARVTNGRRLRIVLGD